MVLLVSSLLFLCHFFFAFLSCFKKNIVLNLGDEYLGFYNIITPILYILEISYNKKLKINEIITVWHWYKNKKIIIEIE